MKKQSILVLAVISVMNFSYAQETSKNYLTPTSLEESEMTKGKNISKTEEILKHFLTSASIENDFYNLQNGTLANGKRALVIGVNGMIYGDDEVDLDSLDESDMARIRIIPYDLKISQDGRHYIQISAADLVSKNDNTKIRLGIIEVERKKDMDYLGQVDNYVKLISGEIQQVFFESKNEKTQLVGNAGLNIGFTGKLNTPAINLSGYTPGGSIGTGSELKLGLGIKHKLSDNSAVDFGISGSRMRKGYGDYINPVTQQRRETEATAYSSADAVAIAAQKKWDEDKFNYEVANGYGSSMDAKYYMTASGASARPSDAPGWKNFSNDGYWEQKVVRKTLILNPEVGYTKTLKSGNKLRVNVSANLVMSDNLKGKSAATGFSGGSSYWVKAEEYVDMDIRNVMSSSRVNMGLTFTFGSSKK
ncbi:MAG: hypothetical protein ACOYL6_14315 [Bacteriovoracaceae bacterium]